MSTPSPSTAVTTRGAFPPKLLDLFRRGSVDELLAALALEASPGAVQLARLAVDTRRESVAVLGNHEVFVRRTSAGDLRQVIAPVRLSLAEKTLYQIPVRKPHNPDTGEVLTDYKGWQDANRPKKAVWKEAVQTTAEVSYQGFLRINSVVGCAVGQPPTVMVDGEPRTNPYLQRVQLPNGRLGDIIRVVVAVTVVGPTPATGNPVVVNYTLDYDPAKDLQHMLATIAEDCPDDVYLVDEEAYEAKPGWKLVPLYGGVGYAVNLRVKAVAGAYSDFVGILQNALKKAQTIARRNAMKNHPALAFHTVEVDGSGRSVLGVTGWAGDRSAMDRWTQIMARVGRGEALEAETVDLSSTYDPASDRDTETRPAAPSVEVVPATDADTEQRNRLVMAIDEALALVSPAFAAELGYSPRTATTAELQALLTRINSELDKSVG